MIEINVFESTIKVYKEDVRKMLRLGIQTLRGQEKPSMTTRMAARVARWGGTYAAKKLFGSEIAEALGVGFDVKYPIEGRYDTINMQFVNAMESLEAGIGRGVVSPTADFKREVAKLIYLTLDAEVDSTVNEFLSNDSKDALFDAFTRQDTLERVRKVR